MKTRNNPVGIGCLLIAIIIVVLIFIIVSCTPTKRTLQSQINLQSEQIDILDRTIQSEHAQYLNAVTQKDSVSVAARLWQAKFESSETRNKSLLENSLILLTEKHYYENGNIKSETEIRNENAKTGKESSTVSQTSNIEDKYLTLLANSKHEHEMLLDYARENDSLRSVVQEESILKQEVKNTEKTGLNWWQKIQIIGFWILLTIWAFIWGFRKFMNG
ncbi:MAG: hypothetical protein FWF72_06825 [Paludibacter sp.]|nr:hypothetical protein [Paludibacter sp.]